MIAKRTNGHVDDDISIRVSKRGEEEQLGRVGWESFHDGEPEPWTRYFLDNVHRGPDDTLVAEVDGAIAGHASALRLTFRLQGVDVPMRGVAAVAVSPDYRRRGVADRLMRELLRRMRQKGDALSILYPFKTTFYQKFGYGTCEWVEKLRCRPRNLPPSPLRRHVRKLDRERDLRDVRRVYDEARARLNGPLVRSDYWWEMRVFSRIPQGVVFVDPASRKIAGYMLYEIPKEPRYPAQLLDVKEIMTTSPDAYRGLVGWLEAMGEQIAVVEIDRRRGEGTILTDEPEAAGLPAERLMPAASVVCSGAMGRVVDVAAALSLHPGPAARRIKAHIGLDLSDPVFAAQSRPLDVTFEQRTTTVTGGREARERLTLGVDRLAQIYFGGTTAAALRESGLISGSERAAAVLDDVLGGQPFFLSRPNFF